MSCETSRSCLKKGGSVPLEEAERARVADTRLLPEHARADAPPLLSTHAVRQARGLRRARAYLLVVTGDRRGGPRAGAQPGPRPDHLPDAEELLRGRARDTQPRAEGAAGDLPGAQHPARRHKTAGPARTRCRDGPSLTQL